MDGTRKQITLGTVNTEIRMILSEKPQSDFDDVREEN